MSKKLSNKAILIIGIVVVVGLITGLILLSRHEKKNEPTTTTTQTTVIEETTKKDTEQPTVKLRQQTDYDSAISKKFKCDVETYGGDLDINGFLDINSAGNKYKIAQVLLVSPSGKQIRFEPENSVYNKNITLSKYGLNYHFENPVEQGEWKVIVYGFNITQTGTDVMFLPDAVEDDHLEH